MNELQWRELVEQTQKGDMDAFEKLYTQTNRSVYFTALKLLANEDNAKDVMQDTYITAIEKLGELHDGAKFPQWVNAIAVNKCRRYFRKPAEDSLDEQTEQGFDLSDDASFIPEEYVTNEVKRKVVMDIITRVLSDVQRQTVIMYYYNEMSLEQIAQVMDCPVKTVSSRLVSSREKIKEAVLIYEKKQGDRLHCVAVVPILTLILKAEAQSTSVPDIALGVFAKALMDAASSASASTVSTTAVAGGSVKMGFFTGKVIAAVAAGALAVGGVTAAVILSKNSSDKAGTNSSSVAIADQSSLGSSSVLDISLSSQTDSSKAANSSKADTSSSKADSSSSKAATPASNAIQWTIEDLSAFMDTNVKGKTLAEAKQAISEKFGTDNDNWTAQTGTGKYSEYIQKLPTPIKVYDAVFTEIWLSEPVGTGKIDDKSKYVGFAGYYKEKGYAEVAEEKLAKNIKKDGFVHDSNTFMQMWLTKSGEVSIGATAHKTYQGRLGLVFWPTLTWGK
ncbi:MAG: sigma-70 family RNA polymerase sigma factor [Ruminococcus sp.]|nr:sigma-70 family RNA polymerase sigma factor [Ruminococcus sp.]